MNLIVKFENWVSSFMGRPITLSEVMAEVFVLGITCFVVAKVIMALASFPQEKGEE